MVATRSRAARDGAQLSFFVQMMQESGSIVEIFKFLHYDSLLNFGLANSKLYAMVKDDFRLQWRRAVSRSWWSWFDRLEDQEYADDYPFKKLRRGGLEDDFVTFAAKTEKDMFENIARWCGGWENFFATRQNGATRPIVVPRPLGRPSSSSSDAPSYLRAGDGNKIHHPTKPVVLFDIYCNDQWKWGAVHPLCNDDLRTLRRVRLDEDNYGVFYPYSTRTLGDSMEGARCMGWNYSRRPDRYLLSTDWNDTSTWRFSVSIVSPNFAETLVQSHEIVPATVFRDESLRWVPGAPRYVGIDDSVWVGGKPEMFQWDDESDDEMEDDENRRCLSPNFRFWFYRDKRRGKPKRLHVLMDVVRS